MERTALYNKKGMSLIEVLMALLILAIVSLALMQTALLGMKENLKNAIRDEAVNMAEQKMNELRSSPSASVPTGHFDYPPVDRTFRAATTRFNPSRDVKQIGSDVNTKQITMAIGWKFSGQTYTHSVTTIVRGQ